MSDIIENIKMDVSKNNIYLKRNTIFDIVDTLMSKI